MSARDLVIAVGSGAGCVGAVVGAGFLTWRYVARRVVAEPFDIGEWADLHEEIAANRCPIHPGEPADECGQGCTWLTPATPERYITRPAIGWREHRATRAEWIRLEHEVGLRCDDSGPDSAPVSSVICDPGVVWAWTSDVPADRRLWRRTAYALLVDGTEVPTRRRQVDDRGTPRGPQPDVLAPVDEAIAAGDPRLAAALVGGIVGEREDLWSDGSPVNPWPPADDLDPGPTRPGRMVAPAELADIRAAMQATHTGSTANLGIWLSEPVCRRVTTYPLDGPVQHRCETCVEVWPCTRAMSAGRRSGDAA